MLPGAYALDHNPAIPLTPYDERNLLIVPIQDFRNLLNNSMKATLESLCDSIAKGIKGQIGDRMQVKLAHNVCAMSLSGFYAEV
jgi:hypothetical protein